MADITTITLPTDLNAQGLSSTDGRQLKNYLYQLTEQLRYVLGNLDSDNMSSAYNQAVSANGVKLVELTEQQKADIESLRQALIQKADQIAHDYQSAINQSASALESRVEERYAAQSQSLQASMESLVASQVSQTSREFQIKLAEVSKLTEQTDDALKTMQNAAETWFRFTQNGLEIGAGENGEASPYALCIDNEKLAFLRYGVPVASLQYDKLYISAAEATDRISIGGSAGEGYYDFITTATGLGIKWRAS